MLSHKFNEIQIFGNLCCNNRAWKDSYKTVHTKITNTSLNQSAVNFTPPAAETLKKYSTSFTDSRFTASHWWWHQPEGPKTYFGRSWNSINVRKKDWTDRQMDKTPDHCITLISSCHPSIPCFFTSKELILLAQTQPRQHRIHGDV